MRTSHYAQLSAILVEARTAVAATVDGVAARARMRSTCPPATSNGYTGRSASWIGRSASSASTWPRPRRRGRCPAMSTLSAPRAAVDRIRAEIERNALRARNGIKLVGRHRPAGCRADPEGRRLAARAGPSCGTTATTNVRVRPAAADRLQPDQPQLHPRPDAGQQLRRAAARRRLRRLPARLGRARRAGRGQRARGLRRRLHPGRHRPGAANSPAPTRSTCSATASAATWRCSTPRTTPTRRCAA